MASTWSSLRTGCRLMISRNILRFQRWQLITRSLITFYRRQRGRHRHFVWIWTLTSSTETLRIESQGSALTVHWLSQSVSSARSDLNVFSGPWSNGSTTAFGEGQMFVPEQPSYGKLGSALLNKLWKNS